jgi:hypothetical protein
MSKAAVARMKSPALLCDRHNMPETAVGSEEQDVVFVTFLQRLLQDCYTPVSWTNGNRSRGGAGT